MRARKCLYNFVQKLLLVGLGGLVGTLVRYALTGWSARRFGEAFPTGTLIVNLLGCFLAGFLFHLMRERYPGSETIQTAVFVGLLGGFTTFSAFGLQTFTLLRDGDFGFAVFNLICSNLGGLLLVWAGYTLAKTL